MAHCYPRNRSKFKVQLLLNEYHFYTIVKSKTRSGSTLSQTACAVCPFLWIFLPWGCHFGPRSSSPDPALLPFHLSFYFHLTFAICIEKALTPARGVSWVRVFGETLGFLDERTCFDKLHLFLSHTFACQGYHKVETAALWKSGPLGATTQVYCS